MLELEFINTHLGGHSITLQGLKKVLAGIRKPFTDLLICEIGCGGGDNLRVIHQWATEKKINLKMIGIDINPDTISYARAKSDITDVEWISSDFRDVAFKKKPDVIFNSLFCHHFDDNEMIQIIQWMHAHSKMGFFINDLHRHALAFHSIKLLTRFFSKSYLVKNDAPLSVLRGFKKDELEYFFSKTSIPHYSIEWKWAFRWLITSNKNVT